MVEITALKQAQEALTRNQERNAQAQRAARIGTWDWDIVAGSLVWSDAIEPLFGLPEGGFKGTYEAFLDMVHPDDRERVRDAVTACIEAGVDYDIEHRVVWPDGNVHWVAVSGDVQRDGNGRAVRMLGVMRDIHERKLAQLTLHESQTHYRRLFDEAPHLIFLLDGEGRIQEANAAAEEVLGYSEGELHGLSTLRLLPEEGHAQLRRCLGTLNDGQPFHGEMCILIGKNGCRVPVEVSAVPELHGGHPIGARAVMRDLRGEQGAGE
jgi:PAS domain S-box-containing protein